MSSRFSEWAKQNKLFLELDENPIQPDQSTPEENVEQIKKNIDSMLQMAFSKIKNDLIKTFGQNIKNQVAQTQSKAIEYLQLALHNLTGKRLSESTDAYYGICFKKLNSLFNEVETAVAPSQDAQENVRKTLGITDYLDKMREKIMQQVDRMAHAMHNDKLYQSISGVGKTADYLKNKTNRLYTKTGHVISGNEEIKNRLGGNVLDGEKMNDAVGELAITLGNSNAGGSNSLLKIYDGKSARPLVFNPHDEVSLKNALSKISNPAKVTVEFGNEGDAHYAKHDVVDLTTKEGLANFNTWVQEQMHNYAPIDLSKFRKRMPPKKKVDLS